MIDRWLFCEGTPELLFTENETNFRRLFGAENRSRFVKDGINDFVVDGQADAVNRDLHGTKASARYRLRLTAARRRPSGCASRIGRWLPARRSDRTSMASSRRGWPKPTRSTTSSRGVDASEDERRIQRQSFAGLFWNKQFYHYDVRRWLRGDPAGPEPPPEHRRGRNRGWTHVQAAEVLSMPDTWEYPWYAAWDLAFHAVPLALVDPDFAKEQLVLLLREWYMHPNGQLPAYEWDFSDVNPPVHAWAAWQVYQIEQKRLGRSDRMFLERVFHKLLLNFTWWVNRKDARGQQRLPGRLPRSGQHRRLRSQRDDARAAAPSSSRTRPAGWGCTAST